VKKSPNNTMMRAELAKAYATDNRDADAKKQIEMVLAATPSPQHAAEHKDAVAQAKQTAVKAALTASVIWHHGCAQAADLFEGCAGVARVFWPASPNLPCAVRR
jgi:hypothetical protein